MLAEPLLDQPRRQTADTILKGFLCLSVVVAECVLDLFGRCLQADPHGLSQKSALSSTYNGLDLYCTERIQELLLRCQLT